MDFLISTIAEALRFSFYGQKDQKAQLLDYLREKEVLLILDNFEHLVEGAGIIADLLSAAPKVKILVTSRELSSPHHTVSTNEVWVISYATM